MAVIPDYDNGIVNLSASLLAGFGAADAASPYRPLAQLPPRRVRAADHVVLWLIDGLGDAYVRERGGAFADGLVGTLSSVFPSSTAPAVTSLLTGVAPLQHGIVGWTLYAHEYAAALQPLPFRLRCGAAASGNAGALIGAPGLFDRIDGAGVYVLPEALTDTAYTRATAGRARRLPCDDPAALADALAGVLDGADERHLLIVYWPGLDALGHRFGAASDAVARHYAELADAYAALRGRLAGRNALLIVSADHGFIDTPPERAIDVAAHPQLADCLALPLSGEPRAAYCHVRAGCEGRFERYVADALAPVCDAVASDTLIADGWFGRGAAGAALRRRLGDYTLIMRDDYALYDRIGAEPAWSLVGVHGGASAAEMRVPLIVADL